MRIINITDSYAVSEQISADDVSAVVDAGYTAIICNRPDGEDPGQPGAADIASACEKAGIPFYHLPFQGADLTPELVNAFRDVIDTANGRVFAYCRSGRRSAYLWEIAMR